MIVDEYILFVHSDCRVVRDPQTLKSKGYGFVSFLKKSVSIFLILHIAGDITSNRPRVMGDGKGGSTVGHYRLK